MDNGFSSAVNRAVQRKIPALIIFRRARAAYLAYLRRSGSHACCRITYCWREFGRLTRAVGEPVLVVNSVIVSEATSR